MKDTSGTTAEMRFTSLWWDVVYSVRDLPQVSLLDPVANESDAVATFTLTLDQAPQETVSVQVATAPASASAPEDFAALQTQVTFDPGQLQATVSVPLNPDALDEDDETFTLELSGAQGLGIADPSGTATITDDDSSPGVTIDDVVVPEGDEGTSPATFTVSLDAPSGRIITVAYTTQVGSATSPGDYAGSQGELSFAPGQTERTIQVPVNGDVLFEGDESFTLVLSAPTHATLIDAQGTATITDDDPLPPPQVVVSDPVANESDAVATFTLTLDQAPQETVSVQVATAPASASAPEDFAALQTQVTFDPGQLQATVSVPLNPDALDEDDETFTLELSGAQGLGIADPSGTATITDDDSSPGVTIDDVVVPEGDEGTSPATFTVSLDAPSGRIITVAYTTQVGSATSPGDYAGSQGELSFAPGQTERTIQVPVNGDVLFEGDESFTLVLSAPTHATLIDAQGTATITDDDPLPPPQVVVSDPVANESDAVATFTLTLDQAPQETVSVQVATAPASASAPEDFAALQTQVTFDPGQLQATVSVPLNPDALDEDDETFTLELSGAQGLGIADPSGTATITDDDSSPGVTIDDVVVPEGDEGTSPATFTVSLDAPSGRIITVAYTTQVGSATSPGDYAGSQGELSFAPGQTERTIQVPVNGDVLFEGDESFTLVLSAPTHATLIDAQGTATITDDAPSRHSGPPVVIHRRDW